LNDGLKDGLSPKKLPILEKGKKYTSTQKLKKKKKLQIEKKSTHNDEVKP
jgi:hypothetical protein